MVNPTVYILENTNIKPKLCCTTAVRLIKIKSREIVLVHHLTLYKRKRHQIFINDS